MIGTIKNFLEPKAGIRVVIRTTFSAQAALDLSAVVRSYGMPGWVQVVKGSHTLIELEGPKSRLQALMIRLQQTRLSHQPAILDVTWKPYEKKFSTFRASL